MRTCSHVKLIGALGELHGEAAAGMKNRSRDSETG